MCNKKPAANDVVGACPECGFDITAAELAIDGMCDHCTQEASGSGWCDCCGSTIEVDGSCECDSIEEDDDSDGEYFYPYERR